MTPHGMPAKAHNWANTAPTQKVRWNTLKIRRNNKKLNNLLKNKKKMVQIRAILPLKYQLQLSHFNFTKIHAILEEKWVTRFRKVYFV